MNNKIRHYKVLPLVILFVFIYTQGWTQVIPTATNNGPVCVGSTLTLAGGPNGMLSYSWTGPDGFTSAFQNPVVSTNATLAMDGIYRLRVEDLSGPYIETTTVIINPPPSTPVVTVDCSLGLNMATVTVTSPVGAGYTYSLDAGAFQPGTLFSNVANGNHTITVRNALGCTIIGAPFPVNVPTLSLSSISGSTCGITPITISGNTFGGGATSVSFSHDGRGNFASNSANSSPFRFTFTPRNQDVGRIVIITVTTNDPAGSCGPVSATYTLNVNDEPTPPIVGTRTQPTCAVETGSVMLSGLPAGNWTLTRTPGGTVITGTGLTTTVTGLSAGTYTFTVTDLNNCISFPSTIVVINTPPAPPAPPTIGTITSPTCILSTGGVVLSGLPTGTWTLTRTQDATTITGTGSSTTITGLASGTYNYTVTNSVNCISSPSANIVIPTQPVIPSAPIIGTITAPTCLLSTGSVVLSGLPASGTWTITRSPGGTTVSGTGLTRTITGLSEGTYTFTVANAAGCVSESSANAVIPAVPANPVLVITNPAAVCAPLRVDITASAITEGSTPGLTFTYWVNSTATIAYATPSAAAAGTYYIKGITSTGCFDIAPVIVVVNSSTTANAGTGGSVCNLDFRLSAVLGTGTGTWTQTTGPGTSSFNPSANTTNALVTVSDYGTYTFTWTVVSGSCSGSSVITVNFNEQPVADAGTGGNNCGLAFLFSANPSVGKGTWTRVSGPGTATFSPNQNTPGASVTVTAFGSYVFRWTEVNGTCSGSQTITVNFIQQLAGDAGNGGNECDRNFTLNAVPTTGTGTWSLGSGPGNAVFTPNNHQPNAVVSVDQSGSYEFIWTIVNSTCTSSDNITVIFHETPVLNAGVDTAVCKGGNIQLNAEGTGAFHWTPIVLLNNPNTHNPIATPLTTTTFKVTLTDQFGCVNTDELVVEIRDTPIAQAGTDKVVGSQTGVIMNAELANTFETGVWSIVSGTGIFNNITNNQATVNNLSPGENVFLWTVTNRVCQPGADTVIITIHDMDIPTLITPNKDGRNESFVLSGLSNLGKAELIILDRRGVRVYVNDDYNNTWSGEDYNGNPLPDDTYFYLLRSEKGLPISGYIVIRR